MTLASLKYIKFNSVDIAAISNCIITRVTPYPVARIVLSQADLANANGAKTVSYNYKAKTIVVEGYLEGTTMPDDAETARDTLLGYLTPTEATIEILQAGSVRQYTGTVSDVTFGEAKGGFITFVINFSCGDPFGYDPNYATITASNITSLPNSWSFSIGGSINPKPVIYHTITSPSSATRVLEFSRYNSTTGVKYERITIQKDWTGTTGQVLVIDCINQTVRLQGVDIPYYGSFFEFAPGTNILRAEGYDTSGAASDFTDLNSPKIIYQKRYL